MVSMRLHRFYINTPLEHTKVIIKDERLIHQWRDVFRYNVGSEVILFDGSGNEFDSVIESLGNREAQIRLVEEKQGFIPKNKIHLYISIIKKDNLELVIEKATELGVSKVTPIISERSEKKGFNIERAKKIAIEASEQCGRADIPEIGEVASLESVLESNGEIIIFDPSSTSPLATLLAKERGTENYKLRSTNLFIGPEGGWSPKELEIFKQKKAQVYSFGPLILRAETVAIVALSKII